MKPALYSGLEHGSVAYCTMKGWDDDGMSLRVICSDPTVYMLFRVHKLRWVACPAVIKVHISYGASIILCILSRAAGSCVLRSLQITDARSDLARV